MDEDMNVMSSELKKTSVPSIPMVDELDNIKVCRLYMFYNKQLQ